MTASGITSWVVDGVSGSPAISVLRGETVRFVVNAPTHVFALYSEGVRYTNGVSNGNAVVVDSEGNLTWVVSGTAPVSVSYQCEVRRDETYQQI